MNVKRIALFVLLISVLAAGLVFAQSIYTGSGVIVTFVERNGGSYFQFENTTNQIQNVNVVYKFYTTMTRSRGQDDSSRSFQIAVRPGATVRHSISSGSGPDRGRISTFDAW